MGKSILLNRGLKNYIVQGARAQNYNWWKTMNKRSDYFGFVLSDFVKEKAIMTFSRYRKNKK